MKRVGLLAFAFSIIYAGLGVAGEHTVYGAGVTIEKTVAIETLHSEADEYQGKTVRIDGVITNVCKTRGCWIDLTDADTGKSIRVKVEDGVISFPVSSLGHKASAQGVFEAITLSPEQAAKIKGQHAEHSGCAKAKAAREADAKKGGCAKAKAGQAPDAQTAEKKSDCAGKLQGDTIYQIRGTGAAIST